MTTLDTPARAPRDAAAAPSPGATRDATRRPLPAWLREPLLHFLVIGALLFGIDRVLIGGRDDLRTIVVGADVAAEIRGLYRQASQRDPSAAEFQALQQRWIDNEVLYREGLAMQVDRGDSAIRERVVFKALSVVEAGLKLPPVDDATLRAWFESRRAKYEEPARFDFREAVLSGDSSEPAVRSVVATLNSDSGGDTGAGLRVFKGRPHENLVQSYGADFAARLEAARPGEWRALPTRGAWRAVRLDATSPARPAVYEALRNVVAQDWTDATMAEQRTAAVRTMARRYTIVASDAPGSSSGTGR